MGYAERLLRDVPPDRCSRFARVGGVVVESNHPAFIYGHLSLYAAKVLWQPSSRPPPVPEYFETLFSKDATCKDDPDLYPPMDEITAFFFEGHRMLSGALRSTPDEALRQAQPRRRQDGRAVSHARLGPGLLLRRPHHDASGPDGPAGDA